VIGLCINVKQPLICRRPVSVQPAHFIKLAGPGKGLENGHAVGEIDEAILRKGEARYSSYFQERRDMPPPTLPGVAPPTASFL
jgi:pre-mRNA-processing factor 39